MVAVKHVFSWLLPLAAAMLALALIYHPLSVNLFNLPLSGSTNESLGAVALILAAFLVWQRREQLRALPCQPESKGIWLILLGGVLAFIGHRLVMRFPLSISLALVMAGSLWWLCGRKWVAQLWFPLLLLTAITPLPLDLVGAIAFRMQTIVARFAAFLLGLTGLPVERSGVTLLVKDYAVQVNEACSGWHTFSAAVWLFLVALYWQQPDRWWRWLWCLPLLLPLALIANIFRVSTVALGGVFGQKWVGISPWHELIGLGYFMALALTLFRFMFRWQPKGEATKFPNSPISQFPNFPISKIALWRVAFVLLFLGLGMTAAAWQGKRAVMSQTLPKLPAQIKGWELVNQRTEGTDEGYWFVQASYRRPSDKDTTATAQAFLHLPLTAVHRPKRLLNLWLGQGYELRETRTVWVNSPYRKVPVQIALFVKGAERSFVTVTYLHPKRTATSPVEARLYRMGEQLLYGASLPWLMVGASCPEEKITLDLEKSLIAESERWLRKKFPP